MANMSKTSKISPVALAHERLGVDLLFGRERSSGLKANQNKVDHTIIARLTTLRRHALV